MKDVTLNQREQARLQVLNTVLEYQLPTAQAAEVLGISERQVRRVLAAYWRERAAALVHGNRGRKPRNTLPEAAAAVVVVLAGERYAGFNHSHFTEVLAEREGIHLSRQTVSRLLSRFGLASARRHRPPKHRVRRERLPQEGMLLQIDGSHHPWLDERAPVRIAAGSGRCHRHGGEHRLLSRKGHPGLLPAAVLTALSKGNVGLECRHTIALILDRFSEVRSILPRRRPLSRECASHRGPKPKPRWDVHLPGAGNRGGSLAGVFRPLIAGPSGSAVSPRLSGWTAQPGICRPSPAPPPCCPSTDCQWPPLSPNPDSLIGVEVRAVARQVTSLSSSSGVLRYSRTASPRWAGALSQMTRSGPGCFSLSCVRKATEVPLLLLPSRSIHSTSPVSRHTAE